MNVIVVGCGRVGAELAHQLFRKGHHVTVVDQTQEQFANLHTDFRGRTVAGDILSEDVLSRAGMDGADAVAVVTSTDSLNAVLGHVAKSVYGVQHVIVRNYDPRRRPLHEAFGLQVVSSTSWGVERISELLEHPGMRPIVAAGNGETRIYEFSVRGDLAGRKLCDLLPRGEAVAASLTRNGRALLPAEDMTLQAGDLLMISATEAGANALQTSLLGGAS